MKTLKCDTFLPLWKYRTPDLFYHDFKEDRSVKIEEKRAEETSYHHPRCIKTLQSTVDFHGCSGAAGTLWNVVISKVDIEHEK